MRTYTGSYTLWTRSTPGTSSRDHQPAPVASPICLHGGRSGNFLCAQEGEESQVQETLDACALRVRTKFCSLFSKAENEGNLESQRKCMGNALVPCSVTLYQHLLSLSHLPWLGEPPLLAQPQHPGGSSICCLPVQGGLAAAALPVFPGRE